MTLRNTPSRRQILLGGAAVAFAPKAGRAQQARPLKIGVMNDMSSVYADYQGIGSVVAAELAVDDFSTKLGVPVEIVSADHQNKPDVGASIARRWFDTEDVDVIMDLPNSAVALAVLAVAQEKNKAVIGSGAGSSVMTGPKCSRNFVHWTYDTYSSGVGLGKAVTDDGGKSWFFVTADYAFGKDLEANCTAAVEAAGGKVVGSVRHPINTPDFSSFLLQAQNSGAEVVAFANGGGDTNGCFKQAHEFGLAPKQRLAGFTLNVTNIPALGLDNAEGALIPTAFYWDAQRRHARLRQALPGGASEKDDAQRHARGHVCGDRTSDQGDGANQERRGRGEAGRRDEGHSDRRPAVRQGDHSRRWAHAPPDLSLQGEDAGGVEIRLGLFWAGVHDQARRRLPSARQRRMSVREGLRRRAGYGVRTAAR